MLYLVRWDNGDTEIVGARNELDLFDILDEMGDPYGTVWRRYTGPIWFSVHADPKTGGVRDGHRSGAELGCDTRFAMEDQILKHAFPKLNAVQRKIYAKDDVSEQEAAHGEVAMGAALQQDLEDFPPKGKGWKTFDTPEMRERIWARYRSAAQKNA
jgi:hypothetical protein